MTLRDGAILRSFPSDYRFVDPGRIDAIDGAHGPVVEGGLMVFESMFALKRGDVVVSSSDRWMKA